jgi:hypothetical protein
VRSAWLAALIVALLPGAAAACATCIASPWGDRTFNWGYLTLLLMPFVVGTGVAAVLTRCWLVQRRAATRPDASDSTTHEETT